MNKVWVASDLHFYHDNICKFTQEDGTKCRPWTDSFDMTREMTVNWNLLVKPEDKVYILGDLFNDRAIQHMEHLNGKKILIMGNHDGKALEKYAPYFTHLLGSKEINGCIFTHIPVHPSQLGRWKACVHGHLHNKTLEDKRYLNVCVEQTDYRPIPLHEVWERLRKQGINI